MATANLDLNWEFGRLLVYIAGVSTAIRKNSAYNQMHLELNAPNVAFDVMWLSDSLHRIDALGRAIQSGDLHQIVSACDFLLSLQGAYIDGIPPGQRLKGDPKESFERYEETVSAREGMAVFTAIRDKALAALAA